jgi:hypothetical protein
MNASEPSAGSTATALAGKLREEQAIQHIKLRRFAFYVERPVGVRVNVVIATHLGREYLKTEADDFAPDNLLALPECPP